MDPVLPPLDIDITHSKIECMVITLPDANAKVDMSSKSFADMSPEMKKWSTSCVRCNTYACIGSLVLSVYAIIPYSIDVVNLKKDEKAGKLKTVKMETCPELSKIAVDLFALFRLVCLNCSPTRYYYVSHTTKEKMNQTYDIISLNDAMGDMNRKIMEQTWDTFCENIQDDSEDLLDVEIRKRTKSKIMVDDKMTIVKDPIWSCDICGAEKRLMHAGDEETSLNKKQHLLKIPYFEYNSETESITMRCSVSCHEDHMILNMQRYITKMNIYSCNPYSHVVRFFMLKYRDVFINPFNRIINMTRCGNGACDQNPMDNMTKQLGVDTCDKCPIIYCSDKCKMVNETTQDHLSFNLSDTDYDLSRVAMHPLHYTAPFDSNNIKTKRKMRVTECKMFQETCKPQNDVYFELFNSRYALWAIPPFRSNYSTYEDVFRYHRIQMVSWNNTHSSFMKRFEQDVKKVVICPISMTAHDRMVYKKRSASSYRDRKTKQSKSTFFRSFFH